MKKRILVIICLIFLIIGISIPVSFSKYTTTTSSVGNINIAKWEFTINDESLNKEFDFNLFDTIDNSSIKNGVVAIAPGSTGKVIVNLKNKSDVLSEYSISFEEILNDYNIPILYSLDDVNYQELNQLMFDNNEILDINHSKKITLFWKWDYFQSIEQNQLDNQLGASDDVSLKIKMVLKAQQKIS